MSEKIDFRTNAIKKDKEGHYNNKALYNNKARFI